MKRMTTLSAVGSIQQQPEPEPEEDEEKKKKKKGKKSKNAKPEEVVEPLIINRETVHDVWLWSLQILFLLEGTTFVASRDTTRDH